MEKIELGQKYSYEKYLHDIIGFVKNHAGITKLINYGKTHDNRMLYAILLGKGNCTLICSAGVHGRESINTIVLMKIIETYIDLYETNTYYTSNIRKLLNECSILFVPLVNPDGYVIATSGFDNINNMNLKKQYMSKRINAFEWKNNVRNIDINRNFASKLWKKKSISDKPFSENESFCLKRLFDKYRANIYLDFHSRGNSIYYYRQQMNEEYNKKQFIIANLISNISGYTLCAPSREIDINDSGGNTVHYYSETIGGMALTIETLSDEVTFPIDERYQIDVFNRISKIPLAIIKRNSLPTFF